MAVAGWAEPSFASVDGRKIGLFASVGVHLIALIWFLFAPVGASGLGYGGGTSGRIGWITLSVRNDEADKDPEREIALSEDVRFVEPTEPVVSVQREIVLQTVAGLAAAPSSEATRVPVNLTASGGGSSGGGYDPQAGAASTQWLSATMGSTTAGITNVMPAPDPQVEVNSAALARLVTRLRAQGLEVSLDLMVNVDADGRVIDAHVLGAATPEWSKIRQHLIGARLFKGAGGEDGSAWHQLRLG